MSKCFFNFELRGNHPWLIATKRSLNHGYPLEDLVSRIEVCVHRSYPYIHDLGHVPLSDKGTIYFHNIWERGIKNIDSPRDPLPIPCVPWNRIGMLNFFESGLKGISCVKLKFHLFPSFKNGSEMEKNGQRVRWWGISSLIKIQIMG
mgnify:CR=1 FL=1